MIYPNVINLITDKLKLDLLPEFGGRINKLVFNEFDIFLPFQTQVIKPLQTYKGGSFSLVPFSNRIKNSTFNFNQLEYKLAMNCLLYTSPSPRDRQKSRMPGYG